MVHAVIYRDGVALLELTLLDAAALVLLFIAALIGPALGRVFASVLLFTLAIGLPLAGFGYAAETIGSRHLSNMLLFVGLVGVGTGLSTVSSWHALLGAAFFAGGVHGLVQIHQLRESLMVALPFALVFATSLVSLARRRPTAPPPTSNSTASD